MAESISGLFIVTQQDHFGKQILGFENFYLQFTRLCEDIRNLAKKKKHDQVTHHEPFFGSFKLLYPAFLVKKLKNNKILTGPTKDPKMETALEQNQLNF